MVMNIQNHRQWLPHKKSDATKAHALPFTPKRKGCEGKDMPSHSRPKEGMRRRGTCPHPRVKSLLEKRDGGAALGQIPSVTLFEQQGGGVRA